MVIKDRLLCITVDGDALKLGEDFLRKAIHDKLYNIAYRKTRNANIARLVKLGKEAEAKS
jgi:hypothetical protein